MANEISIQAVLTQQRFSPVVVQGLGTKDVTATASKGVSNIQNVGTSETALDLGTIDPSPPTSLYYIFVKNLHATIDVELSTPDGSSGNWIFALLKPSEFCLVPVKGSRTIKAKAASSTADILVVAATTA